MLYLAWAGPVFVPLLCSAMSVLEGGALGRGGGRGREPELVCEPELFTCIVGRGPPERIILTYSSFSHERCSPLFKIVANILLAMLLGKEPALRERLRMMMISE